jgi:cyclohexa-1,5-dienecarbonyl-CoA hydratase
MMTLASSSALHRIAIDVHPPVARIRLNNPPLNVIDLEMMAELLAALEQIEANSDIIAIVLAGSGQVFSSGVDVAAHTPENVRNMLTAFHGVIRAVVATKKLTIAAVRRHCLGGAAELALLCDIAYASPDSVWGFPEIKLACFPPVAAVALASIVGQKLAAEMVLTGRTITSQEALAAGLVNGIADDPETLVAECISRVSQLSPAAIALAKKAFYAWDSIHFDKGLVRSEQIYLNELMNTADAQEGIKAYMERRRPQWVGR